MTKQELNKMIKEAGIEILKESGGDETHVTVVGNSIGIAGILGKALIDIANQSEGAKDCIYSVCKAIVDEVEEQEAERD